MIYSDPYSYNSPYSGDPIFDWDNFDLMKFLFDDISVARIIMFVIVGFVLFLTVFSIGINVKDWIVNVYRYAKMGWFQFKYPDYRERIIRLKYEIYVVGIPTGEVFYVNRQNIKKLKRRGIISWQNSIGCYVFDDDDIEEIENIVFKRYEGLSRVVFN